MFRLPVSQLQVALRQLSGAEDLLLLEAPQCDTVLAVTLVTLLATPLDGSAGAWELLTVTDFEVLLLRLRQWVCGDLIRTDARCPTPGCAQRVDVSFRIEDYMAYHKPRTRRDVGQRDAEGWWQFPKVQVQFRLPTVADQIAVSGLRHPKQALIQRCIRPANLAAGPLRQVETAMGALAPRLSNDLQGCCTHCGSTVDLYFNVQRFVLWELRNQAGSLYEDIHLLAQHYHWTEERILALPRARRMQYAELLAAERSMG